MYSSSILLTLTLCSPEDSLGMDLTTLPNSVLNHLVDKSRAANLTFSPEKTVAMVFSPKKRKILTRLYINGLKLKTVNSTRYLGVTIDNSLSWTPHINQKIDQCSTLLRLITRKTSSYFGPKPKLMRWVYTGIIRPKLTYGALVWAHNLSTKQHKKT